MYGMIEIREANKSQAAEIACLIMTAMTDDCCLYFFFLDRLLFWSWRCHHRHNPWSLRFQAHSQSGVPICCLCLYRSQWNDYSANKRLTRKENPL